MGFVRILIVDDFEPWRRSVCSILADDKNLQVVGECSDGLEAVQRSEELQPDIVLLDIELPGLNGLDAARQIRKASPDSKIVFLSSYHFPEMMQEAVNLGAGYVAKADAVRDLLPIIRAVVRNEPIVRFKFFDDGTPDPS